MAGTLPSFSLSQQVDINGVPLNGGKLYFYQAGTTSTPQNAYSDSGLTNALPNPITLDSAGRIPQFFLADGQIKIKLTDSAGVVQLSADNLLVIGASSGGGGGVSVDASTVLSTGDIKQTYGTGTLTGFVRGNGRTIGSASSGASERANADTEDLFVYLWGIDSNLSVSGGRGASGAADFAANKALTLPDFRGRLLASLDDMGNSAAGRLTSSYFGAAATTLGNAGGSESTTLTAAQIPSITSANASQAISVTTTVSTVYSSSAVQSAQSGAGAVGFNGTPLFGTLPSTGSNSISVTSNNTSGQAHRTVPPTILVTTYIKL